MFSFKALIVVVLVCVQGTSANGQSQNQDLPFGAIMVSRQRDGSEFYEIYKYGDDALRRSNETVRVLSLMSLARIRTELELSDEQESVVAAAYQDLDRELNALCVEFTVDGGDSRSINLNELYKPVYEVVLHVLDGEQETQLAQLTARDYASRLDFDELIKSPFWGAIGVTLDDQELEKLQADIEEIEEQLAQEIRRAKEQALQDLIDALPASERGKVEAVFGTEHPGVEREDVNDR